MALAKAAPVQALVTVDFRDGTAEGCGSVTEMRRQGGGLTLQCLGERTDTRVMVWPGPGEGQVALVAEVTNRGTEPIWRVRLQPWRGLAIGGEAEDDEWVAAQNRVGPMTGVERRSGPCRFSFDWVCVTDRRATVHARFEDRALLDTEAEFGRDGERGMLGLAKFPRIMSGETWATPPLVVGAYRGGDWHPAADRFSQWWYSWAQTPRFPEWLQRLGGMTVGLDVHGDKALENLPKTVAACREGTEITAYHGAGWFEDSTECWYPVQYRLTPDMLRRLREVTDAARALGARTSIYTNPLMFSRGAPEFELYGRWMATVASDGGIWFTEHHTHHHPMDLPYPNAWWGAKYSEIVEQAVLLGRPDFLYMDQLGAVPAHLDFAPEQHGHRHYGEWTAGSVEFVRTVEQVLVSR